LLHANWHGFTPTDLVFPSFLFAVGNAMAFTMHKFEGQADSVFWKKTLKRTALIFLLGFLLYWFPFFTKDADGSIILKPLNETRIMGVLQRIALCYFFTSVIFHYGSKKFVLGFSALALVGYWVIMRLCGDPGEQYSLGGNAALKLDLFILGDKHLYHGERIAFDPEGILSTLPAIVNVIAGYLAGDFIRKHGSSYEVIARLMIVGSVLIFSALTWDILFPINKKLWTSSFVLLTIGIDLFILSTLIYLIETLNYRKGSYFFTVFGKNPLFIYLLSEVLLMVLYMIPLADSSLQKWIFNDLFGSLASPIHASFLFAFFFMFACWVIGYVLDKKKIYIRV